MGELVRDGGFPAVACAEIGQGGAQRMGAEGPEADPGGTEQPGGEEGEAVRKGHAATLAQRKAETSAMVPAGPGFPTPAGADELFTTQTRG